LTLFLELAGSPNDVSILAFAHIDLVCMRRNNHWCATTWIAADAILEQNSDAVTLQNMPLVCDICNFAYLHRFRTIYTAIYEVNLVLNGAADPVVIGSAVVAKLLAVVETYLGAACIQNLNGVYCLTLLSNYPAHWSDSACPQGSASCQASCKTALTSFFADVGCCGGSYFNVLEWACLVTREFGDICTPDPFALELIIESNSPGCGLTIPRGCIVQRRRAQGVVVFQNLDWGWCAANLQACMDAVRAVILYRSGITDQNLPVTVSQGPTSAANGGRRLLQTSNVQVSVVAANEDVADLTNIQSDLNSNMAGDNGFNSYPADARGDDSQGVTLAATMSVEPNAGSSVTPTFGLLLAAIVALVAL